MDIQLKHYQFSCFLLFKRFTIAECPLTNLYALLINDLKHKVNWLGGATLVLYLFPVSIIFVPHNEICQAVLAILSTSIARDMTGSLWIAGDNQEITTNF